MELITCKNGHRYDPSVTSECPECARLKGFTVPLDAFSYGDNIGKTVPLCRDTIGGTDNIGKTMPLHRDTMPINSTAAHWADTEDYRSADRASDGYDPTMPVNYDKGGVHDKAAQPVTGWLVCIDGPEKGRDYRLHEEYNYIGRSTKMDVCIAGDPTVSRENHAIIAYDTQERMFFFAPSSGASIVRHNGKAVLNNVELKYGDRLQIGKGMFLFVPLCGENFQWTD